MDLRTALLREHSRMNTEMLTAWAGRDKTRIDELFRLFLNDEISCGTTCGLGHKRSGPEGPGPHSGYIGSMLQRCQDKGIPVAVKRNVTRILQRIVIPEAHQAAAMNLCFDLLADPGKQ